MLEFSEVQGASSKRHAQHDSDAEDCGRPSKKPIFGTMWKLENFLGNSNEKTSRESGTKGVQACGDIFQETYVKNKNSNDPTMKKEKSSFVPPYASKK